MDLKPSTKAHRIPCLPYLFIRYKRVNGLGLQRSQKAIEARHVTIVYSSRSPVSSSIAALATVPQRCLRLLP